MVGLGRCRGSVQEGWGSKGWLGVKGVGVGESRSSGVGFYGLSTLNISVSVSVSEKNGLHSNVQKCPY